MSTRAAAAADAAHRDTKSAVAAVTDMRTRSRAPTTSTNTSSSDAVGDTDGDAFYRSALLQMQSEFARAVEALEKQVTGLSAHNVLLETVQQQQQAEIAELRCELEATGADRQREQQQARDAVTALTNELAMSREDARSQQVAATAREHALQHESVALAQLLQQEQSYWRRFEGAKQREVDALHAQLAAARTECEQHREQRDALRCELQPLQRRVDSATRASRSLEQRLTALTHEAHDAQRALEAQVTRLQRKLRDAREQNTVLSDALAAREEQMQIQQAAERRRRASDLSVLSDPTTDDTIVCAPPLPSPIARVSSGKALERPSERMRKRDGTPSSRGLGAKRPAPTSVRAFSRMLELQSHAPTSPTASSPDMTPPTTPHKRESNSAQARRSSSNSNDGVPTRATESERVSTAAAARASSRSTRFEREMSVLRHKLDACMQLSAADDL